MDAIHHRAKAGIRRSRRHALKVLTAAAALATLGNPGIAIAASNKKYPERPIRLILGFAAGAATDAFARLLADQLGNRLGQQFIVENKPGAATRIAMDTVQKAAPDGYVLGFATAVTTAFPLMFDGVDFAAGKDFSPVAMLGRAPMFLVVRDTLPVRSYAEFVAYGKRKGPLNFGHQGNGSNPHLAGMALGRGAGFEVVAVPYKGGGPIAVALTAGELDYAMLEFAAARPMLERGSVRLLMVTDPERSPLQPDVPSYREVGAPADVDGLAPWFMLVAPPGTDTAVVQALQTNTQQALALPEVRQAMSQLGIVPGFLPAKEAGDYFQTQRTRIAALVKALDVSIRN